MSPPAEPLSGPVQVTFVDFPAAIGVSESFTPLETNYPALLSLLNALSASISHKLENLPYQYVQGQGFTLSDGGWWYRFVKSVEAGTDRVGGGEAVCEYGPWTLLDCLFGYEKLAAELTLGVKWSGANVEIQHNMQKKRDTAAANQAQEIGTHGHGFQHTPQQQRSDPGSESTVPSAVAQDYPQQFSRTYENVSTVTDSLRFGYDPGTLSQLYHGNDFVRQEGDTMMIDVASSSSVGKRGAAEQLNTGYMRPLVVSSPFTGPVSSESEDEADIITPKPTSSTIVAKPAPETTQPSLTESENAVVTPRPASSTPVAKPATEVAQPSLTQSEDDVVKPELRPSTPVAKTVPEIAKPNLAQSQPEPLKGPAGITILPAYSSRISELASETVSNADIASNPELGPPPKLYPPPPRATGSPNDKYRQVPRSGGAIRDPSHRPFQYQYGGPDQQLVGGALPPAYKQQPRYPYPQQVVAQSQYYSPASALNRIEYAFNQNQRSGLDHRQLFDPNTSSGVAYRGRSRGARGRGGHDKTAESKRYSSRGQHQTGRRLAGSGEGQYVPLDPALEENQTYGRQNTYSDGQSRYTSENIGQYKMQSQYAAALQYDNNRGLGSGNSNSRGYGDSYQYGLAAPLAFNNENPTNYPPTTFAADEQEPFPDFDPEYNPEMDMMAPAPMVAPPARQEQRQPFVPSPLAAEFTPRLASVRQEFGEQSQAAGQERAFAHQFPHFQQGHAMMPPAPGSFGGVMLMPVPTPAEMLTRLGLPHLTPYERPRQVVPMPMPTPTPPMGQFTPPRTRNFGRQGGKKTHWTDEANECAILDDDEDCVGVNFGRAGEVDAEKERKKEALKLKKKAKKAKQKRGGDLGFSRKMEARALESDVGGQGGVEATTRTAPSTPTLPVATTTAGPPTLATAPTLAAAPILASAPTRAVAPIVAEAPTLAAAPTTRMSYAAILAAAPAPTLVAEAATTTSHAASLALAPLPTPATSPTLTAAEFESRLEVIIEEDDMMAEG